MQVEQLATAAINHLLGRMLRRMLVAAAVAAFAIVAIYQFTIAGTLALDAQYGDVQARLIVAAIYSVTALACCVVLWAMRGKASSNGMPAVPGGAREMQMVMLVEAAMLGYALARKRDREH